MMKTQRKRRAFLPTVCGVFRKKLEAFGCKVGKIDCKAEEADMTWLDQLEDAIFGPRDSTQKQPPAEDKSDKKAAAKKKTSQEER